MSLLIYRLLHMLGRHYTTNGLGLTAINEWYWLLCPRDQVGTRCLLCDQMIHRPGHEAAS